MDFANDLRNYGQGATCEVIALNHSRERNLSSYPQLNIKYLAATIHQTGVTTLPIGGQLIKVSATACNYGGHRYWLVCPQCGKRYGVLYRKESCWACRKCQGLAYGSQIRESPYHDYTKYFYKAVRIARKLDATFNPYLIDFVRGYRRMFPDKPKGMHWRTYERLSDEYFDNCTMLAITSGTTDEFTMEEYRQLWIKRQIAALTQGNPGVKATNSRN